MSGTIRPVSVVREVAISALINAGVPSQSADIQVDLWMEAELRGHPSHGLLRLPRIVARIENGIVDPTATGQCIWQRESFLEVDGQNGLGPVVAGHALELITERARLHGISIASIHHNNHLGMLAIYAERVALAGQYLIALTTSEALVHPFGGRQAMLGTNPIAIGVPAQPFPLVLDMATSVVSMGKIHDYANRGEPLPSGWAQDSEGNPTTDAKAATRGAIAPFGEAKGYALGLAFEVLVAGLTASALGRDVRGTLDSTEICNKGDVFIVIDPAKTSMAGPISNYLQAIRQSGDSDGSGQVLVPGDRAQARRRQALERGITLADPVWKQLCALASVELV